MKHSTAIIVFVNPTKVATNGLVHQLDLFGVTTRGGGEEVVPPEVVIRRLDQRLVQSVIYRKRFAGPRAVARVTLERSVAESVTYPQPGAVATVSKSGFGILITSIRV